MDIGFPFAADRQGRRYGIEKRSTGENEDNGKPIQDTLFVLSVYFVAFGPPFFDPRPFAASLTFLLKERWRDLTQEGLPLAPRAPHAR